MSLKFVSRPQTAPDWLAGLGGCSDRVSSSLPGPVFRSHRALSGRLKRTVQRHKFSKDSLSTTHPRRPTLETQAGVQGSGRRVSGFRAQSFRVQGPGFRAQGLGLRVSASHAWPDGYFVASGESFFN